jgi:predicted nucleotidyltransferase
MRLRKELLEAAVEIILNQYGKDVKIWLFGSRVDENKLGGDVDIFVELIPASISIKNNINAIQRIQCQSRLTALFDLKVDLIVGYGDKPIHRIAKAMGVCLQ